MRQVTPGNLLVYQVASRMIRWLAFIEPAGFPEKSIPVSRSYHSFWEKTTKIGNIVN
jgi:hypothetical protein